VLLFLSEVSPSPHMVFMYFTHSCFALWGSFHNLIPPFRSPCGRIPTRSQFLSTVDTIILLASLFQEGFCCGSPFPFEATFFYGFSCLTPLDLVWLTFRRKPDRPPSFSPFSLAIGLICRPGFCGDSNQELFSHHIPSIFSKIAFSLLDCSQPVFLRSTWLFFFAGV